MGPITILRPLCCFPFASLRLVCFSARRISALTLVCTNITLYQEMLFIKRSNCGMKNTGVSSAGHGGFRCNAGSWRYTAMGTSMRAALLAGSGTGSPYSRMISRFWSDFKGGEAGCRDLYISCTQGHRTLRDGEGLRTLSSRKD